jgi:hypothetical protein
VVAERSKAAVSARRVQAYRSRGLAGIAPYARAGGQTRSPAEELRTATKASQKLEQYAPAAYEFLLSYPNGRLPGTEEVIRWSHFGGGAKRSLGSKMLASQLESMFEKARAKVQ